MSHLYFLLTYFFSNCCHLIIVQVVSLRTLMQIVFFLILIIILEVLQSQHYINQSLIVVYILFMLDVLHIYTIRTSVCRLLSPSCFLFWRGFFSHKVFLPFFVCERIHCCSCTWVPNISFLPRPIMHLIYCIVLLLNLQWSGGIGVNSFHCLGLLKFNLGN